MIKPPSQKTLAKYGLSEAEWLAILKRQGGVCPICTRPLDKGRTNIDHDHVYRWKAMKPEVRKIHTRGILHWFCNKHYIGRALTIAKAQAVVAYLEAHSARVLEAILP